MAAYVNMEKATRTYIIPTILVILGAVSKVSGTGTYQDETRLFSNLTTNYMACVRPSLPTTVNVYYSIRTLENLNIASQTMTTSGWLTLTWVDSRLSWTPSDFGNIGALEVDFVWRPKFVIANQVDEVNWHGVGSSVFRIFNNGSVRWSVPLLTETSCDVNILLFPFDTQTCTMEMNFWTVSNSEIDSVLVYSQVNTQYYTENGEWLLESSSAEKKLITTCCPQDSVPAYVFSLTYQRKRQYYVTNLLLPTFLMSFVVMWTFILPTESGERLGFSLTVLLSYTVILTLTAGMLPTTSIQMPHISIYILVVLILCTTSVALTVINVKLFNTTGTPPLWLQKVCSRLEPLLFCKCCSKSKSSKVKDISMVEMNEGREKEAEGDDASVTEPSASDMTWVRVSEILDRLFFYTYLMIILCLNLMFVVFLLA